MGPVSLYGTRAKLAGIRRIASYALRQRATLSHRGLKELHPCLTKPHGIGWGGRNRPVDAKDGHLERVARRDRLAQDQALGHGKPLDRRRAGAARRPRQVAMHPDFGIIGNAQRQYDLGTRGIKGPSPSRAHRVCRRPPEQCHPPRAAPSAPPPPRRRPVPRPPACPCPAARAGGLPAAARAGPWLASRAGAAGAGSRGRGGRRARPGRAPPREGGWGHGGDGRGRWKRPFDFPILAGLENVAHGGTRLLGKRLHIGRHRQSRPRLAPSPAVSRPSLARTLVLHDRCPWIIHVGMLRWFGSDS
jgi:hypothetical protein